MTVEEMGPIVEAILFAAGEPVAVNKICGVLGIERTALETIITGLADQYDQNRRGICLVRVGDKVQLCARPDYAEYVRAVMEVRRPAQLSPAALEVLAITAYRQPVTRIYIDEIRGVDSSYTVSSLVDKGLIVESGKLDVPGRPTLYKTTDNFLRVFGLNSIKDLEPLPSLSDDSQLTLLDDGEISG